MDRYLKNIPENDGFDREAGLDCQLVQRILTKIRGSAQQLSALLSLSDKGEVEGRLVKVLDSFPIFPILRNHDVPCVLKHRN